MSCSYINSRIFLKEIKNSYINFDIKKMTKKYIKESELYKDVVDIIKNVEIY